PTPSQTPRALSELLRSLQLNIFASENPVLQPESPPSDITTLADKLKQQKGITITHEVIDGAGHFFDPGMDEMIAHVDAYVRRRMTEGTR
ncbi:MAG: hypothetical protein AAF281_11565, partial [Pseudomonadota bacterium]